MGTSAGKKKTLQQQCLRLDPMNNSCKEQKLRRFSATVVKDLKTSVSLKTGGDTDSDSQADKKASQNFRLSYLQKCLISLKLLSE